MCTKTLLAIAYVQTYIGSIRPIHNKFDRSTGFIYYSCYFNLANLASDGSFANISYRKYSHFRLNSNI